MSCGSTQLFLGHGFVGDCFDHFRSRDKHVTSVFDHEDKICHGRTVHGTAGTRPHNDRNLRNHPRRVDIELKHVGIATQTVHTFLNASSTRVVETNHGRSHSHGHVHDLDHFLSVRFRERSSQDGEILRKGIDGTAVDLAVPGDDAVAGKLLGIHAKFGTAMRLELINFVKGIGIEQEFDAFSCRERAPRVLLVNAFGAATQEGLRAFLGQAFAKGRLENGRIVRVGFAVRSGRGLGGGAFLLFLLGSAVEMACCCCCCCAWH
mmetsp:Transcript_17924/g.42296  ORF Transcript_17924/g.42296 Transcript_17924/m.42296 type:complete len:263 (+) Transcript_17924:1307-2095(+)